MYICPICQSTLKKSYCFSPTTRYECLKIDHNYEIQVSNYNLEWITLKNKSVYITACWAEDCFFYEYNMDLDDWNNEKWIHITTKPNFDPDFLISKFKSLNKMIIFK